MIQGSRDILMCYLRVTQHMSQQLRSHFGKFSLTFPQALVLTVLGEDGPMPISALAEQTGSANSTVSGIVDRLEKLGLAKRERSAADRRVIYVNATDHYRAMFRKTETNVSGYFSALLDDMPAEDRTHVLTALDKLDAALLRRAAQERGEAGQK